jgi:hypothetical protein
MGQAVRQSYSDQLLQNEIDARQAAGRRYMRDLQENRSSPTKAPWQRGAMRMSAKNGVPNQCEEGQQGH